MTHWTEQELEEYMSKKFGQHTRAELADTFQPDEGPESSLQRKAETWLRDHWYPFIHDKSRGKNPPGAILDLHIYLPQGRHVVIELKAKGKKMSDEQKGTFQRINFLGHEIYECKSYKRFLEIMKGEQL